MHLSEPIELNCGVQLIIMYQYSWMHLNTNESEAAQSCPTLCDPMGTRLLHPWGFLGKSTGVGCHFLLQFMKVKSESEITQSCLTLSAPWTAAYQAPPSMGFSRQEYWSGMPLPSYLLLYIVCNTFVKIQARTTYSSFTNVEGII